MGGQSGSLLFVSLSKISMIISWEGKRAVAPLEPRKGVFSSQTVDENQLATWEDREAALKAVFRPMLLNLKGTS